MKSETQFLNLYFQVHQPRRLKKFSFFDVGSGDTYFDEDLNRNIVRRIAKECYLPANKLLADIIALHPEVKITFSISGVALEQFEEYAPAVLQSFRRLAETGSVEFLGETYYHSLAYFIDADEFTKQIQLHTNKLRELIGMKPTVFRNTELIYTDGIGGLVSELGFDGVYIDGVRNLLDERSANCLYRHPEKDLVLFPRNFQLSDDIAFRYSDRHWSEWPLTASKFVSWLNRIPVQERFVCLAMDYETFGEHKKAASGIFHFLRRFIHETVTNSKFQFVTPSEAMRLIPAETVISTDRAVSWADEARDLSAWLGNAMQRDAFDSLYKLHDAIMSSGKRYLIERYRQLQASDHFYYMSTKHGADGAVHGYFSPYTSPYEAFMNYMNVISDLEVSVARKGSNLTSERKHTKKGKSKPSTRRMHR